MLIERLAGDRSKKSMLVASFDDGSSISVTPEQAADFALHSGKELSEDDYKRLKSALELRNSKAKAARMLGARDLSSREVEKRLAAGGATPEAAREAARWLEDIGAIDDARYASAIVAHYTKKGYGPARAKSELYRRGIPRELWDDALRSAEESPPGSAGAFLEKKLRGSTDKDDLRRASDALRARGFSYDAARAEIREYIENLDRPDEEEN